MTQRLMLMGRVLHVRAIQERLHEGAYAHAIARLRLVEQSIAEAEETRTLALEEHRAALLSSDTGGLALAVSVAQIAEWNIAQLRKTYLTRLADAEQASKRAARSRMEREQCQTMHERIAAAVAHDVARKEHSHQDDRYASRRHWNASMKTR